MSPKKGEWGLPCWFRVRTLSFHSKGVCVQFLVKELRSHVLHSQKRRETGWQETQYRRVVLYPRLKLTVPTFIPHSRASTSVSAAHTICCLVAKLCPTLVTPWTAARQVPLPVGFPRQEYWSMLSLPPAEGLPDPGIEPSPPHLLYCRRILYCLATKDEEVLWGSQGKMGNWVPAPCARGRGEPIWSPGMK